ncbi:hypothetical protein MSAN_00294600 [Mycena sanguinolenta]|uniref:Uncharacterized protein n=1 Tax=Mycena sanguinolenta TaxID=230812 RepID=A0A8H6Z7T4_9AGAR|nr:hypothetical protein MSAN_00294600 [Mycena sanguinolenta]
MGRRVVICMHSKPEARSPAARKSSATSQVLAHELQLGIGISAAGTTCSERTGTAGSTISKLGHSPTKKIRNGQASLPHGQDPLRGAQGSVHPWALGLRELSSHMYPPRIRKPDSTTPPPARSSNAIPLSASVYPHRSHGGQPVLLRLLALPVYPLHEGWGALPRGTGWGTWGMGRARSFYIGGGEARRSLDANAPFRGDRRGGDEGWRGCSERWSALDRDAHRVTQQAERHSYQPSLRSWGPFSRPELAANPADIEGVCRPVPRVRARERSASPADIEEVPHAVPRARANERSGGVGIRALALYTFAARAEDPRKRRSCWRCRVLRRRRGEELQVERAELEREELEDDGIGRECIVERDRTPPAAVTVDRERIPGESWAGQTFLPSVIIVAREQS